jgi:hypothetical protein
LLLETPARTVSGAATKFRALDFGMEHDSAGHEDELRESLSEDLKRPAKAEFEAKRLAAA